MTAKKTEHTTIRNNNLLCLNCGQSQIVPFPIRLTMLAAMAKQFNIDHKDCEPTWKEPEISQELTPEEKAAWWAGNGETGISSKAIYLKLLLNAMPHNPLHCHPSDPDDFKRCYNLLKAIPEWKERLHEMDEVSPVWKNLVDNWDKLTAMYEQNVAEDWKNYKKVGMYDFMKTLGC